jgi:phage shock protein C
MRDYTRKGLYRSRSGAVFGVCRGLAEYFDFSVFWVRFIAVAALIFTGLWPAVGLYLIAALIMKPAPAIPIASAGEREFYDRYAASRRDAAQSLKRRFHHLDERIRRMEDVVTSREYDWERRLHSR